MDDWFFVSDLHGSVERYRKLFAAIEAERPAAVLLGGDLLPSGLAAASVGGGEDFLDDFLAAELRELRDGLGDDYPRVLLIFGNDDARAYEERAIEWARSGVWDYLHERRVSLGEYDVYGYAYIPPTPFLLKDWERYDVSRYVDPGCVSPEEGHRSVPVPENRTRYATIADDLERLLGDRPLDNAVLLFHSPPYDTNLDRAALDGKMIDHVPLDVHVGSIAIERVVRDRQPLVTLHGHIHESPRLTGAWTDRIGRTCCLSAAHDGPELALVRFRPDAPERATRTLV